MAGGRRRPLGQLFQGGLQHWLKVHSKHWLTGAPQASKPRQAAQPGDPGTLPTVRPGQARQWVLQVCQEGLLCSNHIHRHSFRCQQDMRKQADLATAPHDPPVLFRCWCLNEALRGTASCLPPRTKHSPSQLLSPQQDSVQGVQKIKK